MHQNNSGISNGLRVVVDMIELLTKEPFSAERAFLCNNLNPNPTAASFRIISISSVPGHGAMKATNLGGPAGISCYYQANIIKVLEGDHEKLM